MLTARAPHTSSVQSHCAAIAHLEAAMLPQHIWELPTNTCSATAHLSPAMQVVSVASYPMQKSV